MGDIDESKIRMLRDFIMIEEFGEAFPAPTNLILPGRRQPNVRMKVGLVLQVGPGRRSRKNPEIVLPMANVKRGDCILHSRFFGSMLNDDEGGVRRRWVSKRGNPLKVIDESQLFAMVEDPDPEWLRQMRIDPRLMDPEWIPEEGDVEARGGSRIQ